MDNLVQSSLKGTLSRMDTLLTDTDTDVTDTEMLKFTADLKRIGEGYLLFVFCVVGVMGNVLAFITFSTKSVRTSTTSVYLRALAVADVLVLITALFRYKTYKIFLTDEQDIDTVLHFDPYIQVYVEPIHWMALGSSSFITIVLSLERYMAVKFPLYTKRSCSVPVVLFCITGVVILSIVITSPNFASYEVQHLEIPDFVSFFYASITDFGRNSLFPCTFHNYIVPIIWYIIPAIFLTILNILLSVHVHKSTRIRVGAPGISNPNRSLTVLIILIVSVYMICNFPKCIFMFYKLVNQQSNNQACVEMTSSSNSPNSKAYLVIQVVTELLNVLNSCMNFIVYCLVGSRFRRELKRLLVCKSCRKSKSWTLTRTHHQSSVMSSITGRMTNKIHPRTATTNGKIDE